MNDRIKEFSKSATAPLLRVSETGAKQTHEFIIDCFEMKDYNLINVLKQGDFAEIFDKVVKISGPCLYYFEIVSNHTADDIVSRTATGYRFTATRRADGQNVLEGEAVRA